VSYVEAKKQFNDASGYSQDVAIQSLGAGLVQLTQSIQNDMTALKREVEGLKRELSSVKNSVRTL
jgi:uncharacterized protein YlxW (UPF0749 family)